MYTYVLQLLKFKKEKYIQHDKYHNYDEKIFCSLKYKHWHLEIHGLDKQYLIYLASIIKHVLFKKFFK